MHQPRLCRAGGDPAAYALRKADKTSISTRYAGFFESLDSRLRGNDEVLSNQQCGFKYSQLAIANLFLMV